MRIPKFGRALAYHFPSAEAVVGAAGSQVYRLNLDHGRFMAPFQLGQGSTHGEVTGCNAVDVNPAHGLLSFGTEGAGVVEMWDQRAPRRAGTLSIATPTIMDASLSSARRGLPGLVLPGEDANAVAVQNAMASLSVTALSSAQDGLNMAVGTSTGHTLLYDLRMDKPYATKDQGFSLPIKSLSWPGDAPPAAHFSQTRSAVAPTEARDTVLSADAKGIKVWPKSDPTSNLVSISPSAGTDLNDVHHLPGSGLVFGAVEGTQCAAWYVPTLGPAPKWCSFLDRITDEIDQEQSSGGKRGVYEDFKFVDRAELESLNMSHLIGNGDVLRPYMHGYFVPLPVYERARLIANPSTYNEARERAIKAKLEKKAESRIRSSGAVAAARKALDARVTVNKDLAEKAARQQQQRDREAAAAGDGEAAAVEDEDESKADKSSSSSKAKSSLLSDSRFSELFTNPDFQIDTKSREYALLNPSSAVTSGAPSTSSQQRRRTAVEEEEDESDRESLDPDQEDQQDAAAAEESAADDDSDGDLGQFDPRNHLPGTRRRDLEREEKRQAAARRKNGSGAGARLVDDDDDDESYANGSSRAGTKSQTFQGRLKLQSQQQRKSRKSGTLDADEGEDEGQGHSITWTPSNSAPSTSAAAATAGGGASPGPRKIAKGSEAFGAGLSKGSEQSDVASWDEETRGGRKKRRDVTRSASKNRMRG